MFVPTYEYQCTACGREFEVRQRISENPLTRCEACGGVLKRLLSAAPFILKGEGWYVTDYPSESRKQALQSEKSPEKSSDKSSDKASDKATDKPASKGTDGTTTASAPAAPPAKTD